MFPLRENEPVYARLSDSTAQTHNRYGRSIETVPEGDALRGRTLRINGDDEVGSNPNRYRQHGFFFNADNCIACHACEAACSEKNDNPAHIAFRSVGFVEGGTYPAYQRINISMACNHCDNPVCLKGCPTRAYTKFAEYGAVLQDPDICFGCGYCTWVCPYNAPQLDPVHGQVTKCNMCVDRLEVGLKPACVSACLGNALDFGVIENIPDGRTEAKSEIPGFPRTDITRPNIRFQQTRNTQAVMVRPDGAAVRYRRDETSGRYRPEVDAGGDPGRRWNLGRLLGSHENAHVVFTLTAQAVMGAFVLLTVGAWAGIAPLAAFAESAAAAPTLAVLLVLMAFGLYKLNMHLGKPHRFYRGFYNLRLSPVSREIAGVSLFFASLAGYALLALFEGIVADAMRGALAVSGLAGGAFGGYYMYRLYRIPARPFWDHWQTATAFAGAGLSLGALLLLPGAYAFQALTPALAGVLASVVAIGLALEGVGLLFHARDLRGRPGEGAVSCHEQSTRYGNTYRFRNALLLVGVLLATGVAVTGSTSVPLMVALALVTLASNVLGRALFYVLVVPTTMPGAFFWKNRDFVEHARESGLADMPQLGVVHERAHPFRLGELLETVRRTPPSHMLAQARRVFTG